MGNIYVSYCSDDRLEAYAAQPINKSHERRRSREHLILFSSREPPGSCDLLTDLWSV